MELRHKENDEAITWLGEYDDAQWLVKVRVSKDNGVLAEIANMRAHSVRQSDPRRCLA